MSTSHNAAEYLFRSSNAGLESFQLSQLARSANLRKELLRIVNDIVRSEAQARAARWLRDSRSENNNPREIPAPLFVPLEGSAESEASPRGLVWGPETWSEAPPAAAGSSEVQNALGFDSLPLSEEVAGSLHPPKSPCRQLQLFSPPSGDGEGVCAGRTANFSPYPQCAASVKGHSPTVFDFCGESPRQRLLNAAGDFAKAVSPMLRLVRFAKLNRLSLASAHLPHNCTNAARDMKVVVFPISGGNVVPSATRITSCGSIGSENRLNRKSIAIFRRSLRKSSPATIAFPFLARCPALDLLDPVPANDSARPRRA